MRMRISNSTVFITCKELVRGVRGAKHSRVVPEILVEKRKCGTCEFEPEHMTALPYNF